MKQSFFNNGWLLFVLLPLLTSAQQAHDFLLEGDKLYDQEKYRQAENQYQSAGKINPGNASAIYNLGNALYQQGKWEDAAKQFETASKGFKSADKKADALHNLGNARLQQQQYDAAVNAYKQSLRYMTDNTDTRKNLQLALKKLKKQQQDQQKRQQQDQQNQEKQQQNQPPDEEPPQPGKKPESGQQPGQKQQTPEQKSREEAMRLLETAIESEDQRNAQKYRTARQKPASQTKKDW
ncbi:MAG: tetratricopeptide repeat protein [Bacteroidota bacterium]